MGCSPGRCPPPAALKCLWLVVPLPEIGGAQLSAILSRLCLRNHVLPLDPEGAVLAYYKDFFRRYAQFSGRSTRSAFWWAYFANSLVMIVFTVTIKAVQSGVANAVVLGLGAVYVLVIVVPTIALHVRRLHDSDHAGSWVFIGAIPIVGPIWLLILMCKASTPSANRYGVPQPAVQVD